MLLNVRSHLGPVAVEVRGSGPAIVMLHGSGSCRDCFAFQVDAFAARYTVVAWDAPGYGDSGDPPAPPSLGDYAEAVQAVAKEVDLSDPFHLLGVSWGGLVAIETALLAPAMVRSVALVGPSFGVRGDQAAIARTQARLEQFRESPERYVEERARLLSRGFPNSPLYRRVAANMRDAVRLPGFAYALSSMIEADVRRELHALEPPLFLAWGSDDPVAGPSCRRMSQTAPAEVIYEVPDAGHLANQDQPALLNAQLDRFWSAIET